MDVKSKGLLRRMFDAAVSELARRASASEPQARRAYRPPSVAGAPPPQVREWRESRPPAVPPVQSEPLPVEPAGLVAAPVSVAASVAEPVVQTPPHAPVVIVRGEAGELRVRWNVSPEHIARSAALLGDPHVPCLRLISYGSERDGVAREILDRPNVAPRGECDVREVPERLIATFGLRAGERFVSVAHAVL
jgi:hypothetical protein